MIGREEPSPILPPAFEPKTQLLLYPEELEICRVRLVLDHRMDGSETMVQKHRSELSLKKSFELRAAVLAGLETDTTEANIGIKNVPLTNRVTTTNRW